MATQKRATAAADHRRVTALLKKWQPRLGLSHQTITLVFEKEQPRDPQSGAGFGDNAHAETLAHFPYQCAEIKIFPGFFDFSLRDQEIGIVHELVHVVCSPIYDCAERMQEHQSVTPMEFHNANEMTVDHLARRFVESFSRKERP